MPPIVRWSSPENTCLIIEFSEKISWADFHNSVGQAHQMIKPLPHTVNLIIWDQAGIPAGNPLSHFQQALKEQPPNVGTVFIVPMMVRVGMLAFMQSLAEAMDRIYPSKSRIKFAKSFAEAQAMADKTLPSKGLDTEGKARR